MHGVQCVKKPLFIGTVLTVCVIVSLVDYWKDGGCPLLTLLWNGSLHPPIYRYPQTICECNCSILEELTKGKDTRNVNQYQCQGISNITKVTIETLPGPSRLKELVPVKTLEENINFDQVRGLRYLDHPSLSRYYSCKPTNKLLLLSNYSDKVCKERTFLNQKHPLVALISFHGSGNTWVRHLVEQATGIFTGSIYCDSSLKMVFPGESVVSGNVAVIKTHQSDTVELPDDIKLFTGKTTYDKAILIVRNPYDALISEANRRWNSKLSLNPHLGVADETAFISNSKWDWLVEYKGATWAFLLHTWLAKKQMPVLVVQYEVLIEHTEHELARIVRFSNLEATSSSLKCAVENGNGAFKRTKHLDFNPYSVENREAMNRYISQAAPILAQYGIQYNQK